MLPMPRPTSPGSATWPASSTANSAGSRKPAAWAWFRPRSCSTRRSARCARASMRREAAAISSSRWSGAPRSFPANGNGARAEIVTSAVLPALERQLAELARAARPRDRPTPACGRVHAARSTMPGPCARARPPGSAPAKSTSWASRNSRCCTRGWIRSCARSASPRARWANAWARSAATRGSASRPATRAGPRSSR